MTERHMVPESAQTSFISRGRLILTLAYLLMSAIIAGFMTFEGASSALRAALGAVLLVGFLVIARVTIQWLVRLDEMQQIIAWRALAAAGLVTVWFQLFLGLAFDWLNFGDLWIVIALGPPEFWLCALVFMRAAERRMTLS